MKAVRVLLVGAKGRMGQAIAAAAEGAGVVITAGLDQGDDLTKEIGGCDVVVDFSHVSATDAICRACLGAGKPLVSGTTGHSKSERALLEEASKSLPVILSPNFSIGVNALFWLTRKAAELLGKDFDLEIVEAHHRLKKDAPSGTAKKLAEILCEVRKLDYEKNVRHGREGLIGERPANEIGVHSMRGGDVVGDHTVTLAGAGERLELTHRASSRETFAAGALRAARWVVGKPPGLYSMEDVLDLASNK
ncbi:MAG TPA: 4-hydroxy-tetrahydrodipicolinate reductase [Chthoniobacterales bacterium]|nr:4-hydroxy-tetrahydrodipicolinate reductase [Chthoniobacterales bacterium]